MKNPDIIFQAKRFCIERVIQTTPDGARHVREIVRHPGAVVVLPLLEDRQVVFVRNYRAAVDETLIELPAGTLDRQEDPQSTAQRELAEETGYQAGRIVHLLTFCMSPGILDEKMHLFLATSLTAGKMDLEPGEDIQPFPCAWQKAMEMARRGDIRDAKTLVGLLYYDRFMR
jgi:ADP-ribose pyrophosphatase